MKKHVDLLGMRVNFFKKKTHQDYTYFFYKKTKSKSITIILILIFCICIIIIVKILYFLNYKLL
jgi:t-SNARE complex subunit (syntaxin)